MNTWPLLSLQNATVVRDGKAILHIDNLAIQEGESIAILGPNGAGKSTFVNLITRAVFPLYQEDPAVVFRGNPKITLEELKQEIGFVSASMQKQITVPVPAVEIVEGGLFGSLGKPLRKKVSAEQHECAICAMEELGIADLADRDMTTLSTGQARRVLIARATVHEPSVLVFDEPSTGLDPQGMYYVRQAMSTLAQQGRTVVLVTHYPEDIVPEIQRILLLKAGHVYADGLRAEVLTEQTLEIFELFI